MGVPKVCSQFFDAFIGTLVITNAVVMAVESEMIEQWRDYHTNLMENEGLKGLESSLGAKVAQKKGPRVKRDKKGRRISDRERHKRRMHAYGPSNARRPVQS